MDKRAQTFISELFPGLSPIFIQMNNNLSLFPEMNKPHIPIVLSLKKEWLDLIVQGDKKYEFRRQFPSKATCAFIYATSPHSHISYVVWFKKPIIDKPKKIVELKQKNKESLRKYLKGAKKAYAAPVNHVAKIKKTSLAELQKEITDFHPPQSYFKLNNHPVLKEILMEKARKKIEKNTFAPLEVN